MSGSDAAAQGIVPAGDEMEVSASGPASPTQVFDLDEAIMQLVGPTINRKGEPVFEERVAAELYKSIRLVLARYKRYLQKGASNALDGLESKMDDFHLWLYGVYQNLNSKTNSTFLHNVKGALVAMQDPEVQLPSEYQLIAAALMPEPAAEGPPRKRQKKASTIPGEITLAPTRKAHPKHPIFGDMGVMRGICIRKVKRITYLIDPRFKKDFKVFGHNGLEIGSVWPLQVAALRDGAHGAPVHGISGTAHDGCYSIVVSGKYSDVDQDTGDIIKYSAAGSLEADSTADKTVGGTSALLRSIVTRQPIRVLRSAGGHWKGIPKAGIRYDGLYSVESSKEVTKRDGGAFIQFLLKRQEGQLPIDMSRPTLKEREEFQAVSAGF
ncbi:E3 ubiquitin-protein ligase [Lachnellula willkommii]|uniref:E3 ubiquitin-protein ligase n=1 Tax=Lachnellula willkommii TaxID=215461 RepID=A0A559M6U1_9HELO|nr:E3 ubiquitin-protein ligase [Lachnellula willkommii]